ncbi:MAG TPA: hypothetical protein VJ371_11910 [Streptosporangiaceae bacterium]|jgi:hypothetical protein|nr:hypothetical protein [Streptosporangiaceae bacterium]
MTKVTVVYLKDTGHVLAALTRANPPQGTEQVSALVGTGLPVRFIGGHQADATVAAQDLDLATVDDQPGVVTNPQSFRVTFDAKGQAQVTSAGAASQITLDITTSSGATVTGATTQVPARVGLQKVVTSSSLAPAKLNPVTVGPGASGTVVAGPAGFALHDIWNMYVLVQGLQPNVQQLTVS